MADRPLTEEKRVMTTAEIKEQIQRATNTIARLNAFEEWLENEAIPANNSPTYILEKYREARYAT